MRITLTEGPADFTIDVPNPDLKLRAKLLDFRDIVNYAAGADGYELAEDLFRGGLEVVAKADPKLRLMNVRLRDTTYRVYDCDGVPAEPVLRGKEVERRFREGDAGDEFLTALPMSTLQQIERRERLADRRLTFRAFDHPAGRRVELVGWKKPATGPTIDIVDESARPDDPTDEELRVLAVRLSELLKLEVTPGRRSELGDVSRQDEPVLRFGVPGTPNLVYGRAVNVPGSKWGYELRDVKNARNTIGRQVLIQLADSGLIPGDALV